MQQQNVIVKMRKRSANTEYARKIRDVFYDHEGVYLNYIGEKEEDKVLVQASKPEREYINQYFNSEQVITLANRLMKEPFEEILSITADSEIGATATAVKVINEGQLEGVWVVIGFVTNKTHLLPDYMEVIEKKRYDSTIRMLIYLTQEYLLLSRDNSNQYAQLTQLKEKEQELRAELHRSNIMTEILGGLESEADIILIVNQMFRKVQSFLNLDYINLLRAGSDDSKVEVISEVCAEGLESQRNQLIDRTSLDFPFMTGQPYILSTSTKTRATFNDFLKNFQIRAMITLPIVVNGQVIMYMNAWKTEQDHEWEVSEIRFLNDVERVLQSVINKRIASNSITASFSSLEEILKKVGCGIYVKDFTTGEILFRNSLYDEQVEEALDKNKPYDLRTQQVPNQAFNEMYVESLDHWYDTQYITINWLDGRKVILCTAYDITDKKKSQAKIERIANRDYLTGLYNRMRCEKDLKEEIGKTLLHNSKGAALYIDLDNFKHINDGLGHQYGDLLLQNMAQELVKVKGMKYSCYRMGGDEFLMIVCEDAYEYFDEIIEQIIEIYSKPWFLKKAEYYCTMSMGVAQFPRDGDSVEEIIKKSDIALYEAKRRGRNQVAYYDERVKQSDILRLDMEKYMRDASKNPEEEFDVYFQPIMDVSGGQSKCVGAEALMRWNSEALGMVSPVDFIPLAEYLGLIMPLGKYVLLKACERCKYWNDYGHPDFKININLSVIQLLQKDMLDTIKEVLEATGLTPSKLTVEVTESLAIKDMVYMKAILAKMKKMGIRVALDDFGTGYSSLSHIRQMPIDVIKIDRCFIVDIGKDAYSEVFVKMVTELGKAIDVDVCVEGVENKEQVEILRKLQVDMIQGYYFDRPLRIEEFEEKYL